MSGLQSFLNVHAHHNYGAETAIVQFEPNLSVDTPAYFSIGIHPEKALIDSSLTTEFKSLSEHKNCLAIGEIGLDSRYANQKDQEVVYILQLQLAKTLNKPIILHCVNQWDRCRFLHEKYATGIPIVYHGFNKPGILDSILSYPDAYISIGPSVLTNTSLQSKINGIPLEKLLCETDTVQMPVSEIYQKVADLKSLSLREFSETININAKRIFKL